MTDASACDLDETNADGEITRTLYVERHGAVLRHRRGRLVVTVDDAEVLDVPAELVDCVVCIGEVGMTPDARASLLEGGVHTVFLSMLGRPDGSLRSARAVDGSLLRAQVERSGVTEQSVGLAAAFLRGKMVNMRSLLSRFDADGVVEQSQARIRSAEMRISTAASVDQLLGLEGAASAAYFEAWPDLLPDWCDFSVRSRRPPKDAANAALGFAYSLLAGTAEGALIAARLEPSIGFLHSATGRRPSLALDLMEEFRPLLGDQVVVEALRKGSLTVQHFEAGPEPGSVWLTSAGRRVMVAAYEQRLHQVFRYQPLGRRVTYKRAVFLQAMQIARVMRGSLGQYEPVMWRT